MTTIYRGSFTIGGAIPGAAGAALAGSTGIAAALPDILARLAALQAFAPQPVNFAAQLALGEQIVASVTAGIALGIPAPSISAQIAAVLALVTSLLAQVSAVNAQLSIVTSFQALLAHAGVHMFAYTGAVGGFGTGTDSSIGGVVALDPLDTCTAFVLLTTTPATATALVEVLG